MEETKLESCILTPGGQPQNEDLHEADRLGIHLRYYWMSNRCSVSETFDVQRDFLARPIPSCISVQSIWLAKDLQSLKIMNLLSVPSSERAYPMERKAFCFAATSLCLFQFCNILPLILC